MARKQSIRFQLKSKLGDMEYYGHSKYELQQQTYEERRQQRLAGNPDYKEIDLCRDKIFSYATMDCYMSVVNRFVNYLEANDMKKCTIEEAAEKIQEYLDYEVERGLSAYSIHTYCAALSKVFGTRMEDYTIPERHLADIKRSRTPVLHDDANSRKSEVALRANTVLGLRRNELKHLRSDNFIDHSDTIEMTTKGKGGKINTTIFRNPKDIETIRELLKDCPPGNYVFDRQQFKNDADFHSTRAIAFQKRYDFYCSEIHNRPEAREEYKKIVEDKFAEKGKILRENLDAPVYCRGSHRQSLIAQGLPTTYDRLALMMVSLECHYRSNVLLSHYIAVNHSNNPFR